MSASTITLAVVLIIAGVVAAVILNSKLHINMGFTALFFAYIIYVFVLGNSPRGFTNLWPTSVFLTLLSLAMFYGFATENGTLKLVADHVMYRVRNVPFLICPAIFLLSVALAGIGIVPGAAGAILIAIFLPIALELKIHPMLIVLTSGVGVGTGTLLGTGSAFGVVKNYIADAGYGDQVDAIAAQVGVNNLVGMLIAFVLAYFIWGGYKIKGIVNFSKPAPATKEQKVTIAIIAAVMASFIIPVVLGKITGNAAILGFSKKINLVPVMFAGAFLCAVFQVADPREVLKKRVGWSTFFMVGGMCSLISIASLIGIDVLIGDWISQNVPTFLVGPCLLLVAAVLSLFSDSIGVVFPLTFSFIPALAAAGGLSPSYLYACAAMGALNAGGSPLSTGGASILAVAPEEYKPIMFKWEWLMVIYVTAVILLCSIVHIFR